jgi:hypothetical protein
MNVSYRCEHDFWQGPVLGMDEPIAALSGLVMSVIALRGTAQLDDPPLQFCIARASIVLCGLGTFAFHALGEKQMADSHLNGIIFDGVSMALVTVNIFLLYLNDRMNAHKMTVSIAALMYLFFWVITNDLLTFNHLSRITTVDGIALFSIVVQYPTFLAVYVYILWRVVKRAGSARAALNTHWTLWVCLFVSLGAWCAAEFACIVWSGLFVGHVVWHVGIGYVAHYLAVIGAAETYGFACERNGLFLKLGRKDGRLLGAELRIDGFFNLS